MGRSLSGPRSCWEVMAYSTISYIELGRPPTPIVIGANPAICDRNPDTADHTLFQCSAWNREKAELRRITGNVDNTYDLVTSLIDSREAWGAFHRFAEVVMGAKEIYERAIQRLPNERF
ncbi:hypothetical protein P5V15_012767 [Pogonomyrmex californicus]